MFSIAQNLSANQAQFQLNRHNRGLGASLAETSSGLRINRASDAPAALVLSEQLRTQQNGLGQTVKNNASATNFVQATEASMEEISRNLKELRKLAVHAANDGANDEAMLIADQTEVQNEIASINRIADQASFGSKKILNGQNGLRGVAYSAKDDKNLQFVRGGLHTQANFDPGYAVRITKAATQAELTSLAFHPELLDTPTVLTFFQNGKSLQYRPHNGQRPEDLANDLNRALKDSGLSIQVKYDEKTEKFTWRTQEYGSSPSFQMAVTNEGWLEGSKDTLVAANPGEDAHGTIGGFEATGNGQKLMGADNTPVEGLVVRYQGNLENEDEGPTGFVRIYPESLRFHLGPNQGETTQFNLSPMHAYNLAIGVKNQSGFKSLEDLDVTTFQGAEDSLLCIQKAEAEVSAIRGRLGSLQKNSLEPHYQYNMNLQEEGIASESGIRDADVAEKAADLVKQKIMVDSAAAVMLHARTVPTNNVNVLTKI